MISVVLGGIAGGFTSAIVLLVIGYALADLLGDD